jgi:hypothetical protein
MPVEMSMLLGYTEDNKGFSLVILPSVLAHVKERKENVPLKNAYQSPAMFFRTSLGDELLRRLRRGFICQDFSREMKSEDLTHSAFVVPRLNIMHALTGSSSSSCEQLFLLLISPFSAKSFITWSFTRGKDMVRPAFENRFRDISSARRGNFVFFAHSALLEMEKFPRLLPRIIIIAHVKHEEARRKKEIKCELFLLVAVSLSSRAFFIFARTTSNSSSAVGILRLSRSMLS